MLNLLRKLIPRPLLHLYHFAQSFGAAIVLGFPTKKLVVIGVTGTDGKTTTSTLIHHILTSAGIKTAISSTLSSLHTTTAGRWRIQKFLSQSVQNGCTHCVLEVTSIAIDQHRVAGVDFQIGVLTNIAQNEHLDYHRTFEAYRQAKLRFLLSASKVVTNADDPSLSVLKSKPHPPLLTYAVRSQADLKASQLAYTRRGTEFVAGDTKFRTNLLGEFNLQNTLAAILTCLELGVSSKAIKEALATFPPPPGRLEIVVDEPITVIVDFAHTPQAFEKVLPVVTEIIGRQNSRLIHVFGATGNRDKDKRPLMAKISARFADQIILTHEDTYTEDKTAIIKDLEQGLLSVKYYQYKKVYDRKEAIREALLVARKGDVVLLTGVGHQKTMNIGGKEVPWSDQKCVKDLLRKIHK